MDVLVKMSVSGAVLIAVIVIVRALAVNRLPKKAFLWLWAAAFFCLMIPVRLPSPISVYRPSGQLERLAVRPGLLLSEAAGQAASEASGAAAVMASHLDCRGGIAGSFLPCGTPEGPQGLQCVAACGTALRQDLAGRKTHQAASTDTVFRQN